MKTSTNDCGDLTIRSNKGFIIVVEDFGYVGIKVTNVSGDPRIYIKPTKMSNHVIMSNDERKELDTTYTII